MIAQIACDIALRFGCLQQLVAKIGVCDFNQGAGAFGHAFAVQRSDAILGHNIMHIAPAYRYVRAFCQRRHNARLRTVLGG